MADTLTPATRSERMGRVRGRDTKPEMVVRRLTEHRESILEAERGSGTLAVADFQARYLTMDDIWIPLGETLLIARFRPVWNIELDGFGNHNPGKGRFVGLRPLWDHLHPGRAWAERCAVRTETIPEIERRLADYLAAHPIEDE